MLITHILLLNAQIKASVTEKRESAFASLTTMELPAKEQFALIIAMMPVCALRKSNLPWKLTALTPPLGMPRSS
jgi:hypothetical protein